MYAIIVTGGKQYRVMKDEVLRVEKIDAEAGANVEINEVLMVGDGDSVTVIKDLKIKGSSSVVKIGTKVRGIRLIDGTGGHDIDCKIDGIGAMKLKSEFVRKVHV